MKTTLQQMARWKSQQNPLEKVCGKKSICQTITTRVAESIGGGINASTILYCEELEETTNIRGIYMDEIKCKQVAQIEGSFESTGRVYSAIGLSPTINTCGGGNREPKIIEPLAYDEQNGYLRKDGIVGTITTDGSSPKHNNRVVEPITDQNRFYKQAFETVKENDCDSGDTIDAFNQKVNKSGVSPTVTTRPEGFKTACLVCNEPLVYDGFNQQVKADSTTRGTITRNVGADLKRNGQGIIEQKIPNIRVRKLTEKECFRLQGVKDEDFLKIRKNQSKSSCYHLAGDSITTSVLMALFGEMLDIKWKDKVDDLVEELQDF